MKKASLNFLVLFLATLIVSFQSHAQRNPHGQVQNQPSQGEVIQQQLNRNLRQFESLSLSEALRLSYSEEREMELISIVLMAEHMGQGQTLIELVQNGRPIASDSVRRNLKEIRMIIPARTLLSGLSLQASGEIFIQSISAEVLRSRIPGPQPHPGPGYELPAQSGSLITIALHHQVRGYSRIPLAQLARQQGVSLIGAQIERVVVLGQPSMYGRSASVQVELNQRPVGMIKYLVAGDRNTPLQVQSMEEVRSGLALIVNGDAQIQEVRIRIGQVRSQGPQLPQSQRIYVGQEVSRHMPLELSRLLGYESRLIRSITIEARTQRHLQAQISLLRSYGEVQGAMIVQNGSVRGTIQLRRPLAAHELRLETQTSVVIDTLELEFDNMYPGY